MPLPETSFSLSCASVAEFVQKGLGNENVTVLVGPPADAVPSGPSGKHHINLFFHRVQPSGFFPDATPQDPWRLRVHCLVTPFALGDTQGTAGENDLRLLGAILRLFAESPVLSEFEADGQWFRLEAVFEPMSLDDINRLWTTQRDLTLRPSAAYEFALVPVLPRSAAKGGPLVGGVRLNVSVTGRPETPLDALTEAWQPQIAFRTASGWAQVLDLVAGPDLAGFEVEVGIAGRPGESVVLHWDLWKPEQGWFPGPAETPAMVALQAFPEDAQGAQTTPLPLPLTDSAGQLLLHAARTYVRGADGATLSVLSNPLLVVLRRKAG